jgi:lysophospholipase L1-like esterase
MHRTLHALTATAVAAATVLFTALPASAGTAARHVTTSPYVALGDSYSSGLGIAPFVPGAPPACGRSLLNYPHDIAARTHPSSFTDVTCSGATTQDFYTSQTAGQPPQLDAVTKDTRLVTMTIGGNDENVFSDSFFGCVTLAAGNPQGSPCKDKFGNTFVDEIRTQTYPHLVAALSAVRAKAPKATVAILGYPTILPEQGVLACFPVMPIAMGDVPWLHEEQEVLNGVVRKAAAATGVRFIDMAPSSAGHDACQPPLQRWIEPAVGPVNAAPVHPNATGEAAMARQTLLQLGIRQTAGVH